MRRNPAISAQSLSRLFEQAVEAWRRQEYSRTIELLERASRGAPSHVGILLDLGRAYGLRYDYAAAEDRFERAVRLAPKRAEILAEAGRRSLEFGHDEMATRYFERACREKPAGLGALLSLAELEERRSRLDAAGELIAAATAAYPDDPRVAVARARLSHRQGRTDEAEPLLRTALAHPRAEEPLQIRAWYELAAVCDRLGRYDEAMTALREAKSLQRRHAAPFQAQLQVTQSRVRELGQTITEGILDRWQAGAAELGEPRPLTLLGGHPRSGTTLLEQMLDAHPGVLAAEETQVFHDEAYLPLTRGFAQTASILSVLDSAPPTALRQARGDYFHYTEMFLREALGERLLVDKNPSLTVLIPVLLRIFPEVRILVALRDPRDVCLSCYIQPLGLNPVSSAYLTIEGTVTQYASVMGLWRELRARIKSHWLEVRYEDLTADVRAVTGRVAEFLGLGWKDDMLKFHERAQSRHLRSPSHADVVKPVYRSAVGRWHNYERYLQPHLPALAPLLDAFGYE
jgi:Flp pilus assembly protein TadD